MKRLSDFRGIKRHSVLLVFLLFFGLMIGGVAFTFLGFLGGGVKDRHSPPASSFTPSDLLKRAKRSPMIGSEVSVVIVHPLTPTNDPLEFEFRASRSGRLTPIRLRFNEPPDLSSLSAPFNVTGTVSAVEGNTAILTSCRCVP